MFEYLKRYVGKSKSPNKFCAVKSSEIKAAEKQLGFPFPSELRTLFEEIGSGFLQLGIDDAKRDPSVINRILPPLEISSLICEPDNPLRPDEGFVEGVLPFFDVGESTYLVVRPKSSTPNKVFGPDGKKMIAKSVESLFEQLYHRAAFYRHA